MRVVWFGIGWINVGIGGLGVVVPGLPSVVFFIAAAYSFSRSSPRFERWVLGLPGIGPMVADYRAGLGMARRAKIAAIVSVVFFGSISALVVSQRPWLSALIAGLCLIGIGWIVFAIPLRERVLLERARTSTPSDADAQEGIVIVAMTIGVTANPADPANGGATPPARGSRDTSGVG